MTYTPIARDSQDWDVPVNAAFTSQDSRLTTAEGNITTNTSNISTNTTQIAALQPTEHNALASGYKAWTFPAEQVSGTGITLTSSAVTLGRVLVNSTQSVSSVALYVVATGTSLVSGQNFAGIYNSSGTLVATTADLTTAWGSTGWMSHSLVGGPYSLTAGAYWVALVSNAATTPAFGKNNNALSGALYNGALTAANFRFATNGTATTALPGTITPASNVTSNRPLWLGLT